MNVVYIDKSELQIEVSNKTLVVDHRKIPLVFIGCIVISANTLLSTHTILQLASENISIVVAQPHRNEFALIAGAAAKNSELKYAQYQALPSSLDIAKYLVSEKIKRHASEIAAFNIELPVAPSLSAIDSAATIGELLGIEGTFAHYYFAAFFGLIDRQYHKGVRSKRPPHDPANALLSYLYTLLYSLLSIRLVASGFEPGIAYLHRPFRTHNALASDMMELFRHLINTKVIQLFADGFFSIDDFAKKDGIYLRYEARKRLYPIIKLFWQELEPMIAFEIAALRKRICASGDL
ncbi:hypothetical protein FACS189487_00310 [Campylobacterota bacterium]|nr:hypothetical protein FACS189487_00310 [Campylobacterota bacterium]